MITLGIDLSSMPKNTAACCIKWGKKRALAESPHFNCTDERLDMLIGNADSVGIDAPFGWPQEFTSAVNEWNFTTWNERVRDRLRFRLTDLWVKEHCGLTPLSVSSDRIALPAMRAMALLRRHGVSDRSGDGKFFEVYPASSLKAWHLPHNEYKKPEQHKERKSILQKLFKQAPWLDAPADYAESADGLDSLIASLTVRAAAQKITRRPPSDQADLARREGWIHLPMQFPFPGA